MFLFLKIFLYFAFAYGLTFAMVYSSGPFRIFSAIRKTFSKLPSNFSEMLECTFCTPCQIGFWLSVINVFLMSSFRITPFMMVYGDVNLWWLIIPMDCFSTGIIVHLCDDIENYISQKLN